VMSDETQFVSTNLRPLLKFVDALVSEIVSESAGDRRWRIEDLGGNL